MNFIYKYLMEWIILIGVTVIYLCSYSYVKDYTVLQFYNGRDVIFSGKEFFYQILKGKIMLYWVFAIIGINIEKVYKFMRESKVKYVNKFIYMTIVSLILYISQKKSVGMMGLIFNPNLDNSYYLYIGDALAMFAILIYEQVKYKKSFLALTCFLLYKIGSRTSFLLFVITILFLIIRSFIHDGKLTYKRLIIIWSSLMLFWGIYIVFQGVNVSDNRMLSVFDINSIKNDSSYGSREKMNEKYRIFT